MVKYCVISTCRVCIGFERGWKRPVVHSTECRNGIVDNCEDGDVEGGAGSTTVRSMKNANEDNDIDAELNSLI